MNWPDQYALLSTAQMYEADALTIDAGIKSADLMRRAGAAVVKAMTARLATGSALILCGRGNNGGDGFVIGRQLRDQGWQVRIALLGEIGDVSGDAVMAAGAWMTGEDATDPEPLEPSVLDAALEAGVDCVIDCVLGAGLSRPVEGPLAEVLTKAGEMDAYRVAVDIPSGISGDTGAVLGAAFRADLTVTFFRKKRGHVLAPGRRHCGELVVDGIGLPSHLLEKIGVTTYENAPELWPDIDIEPDPLAHKYDRGHLLVVGGGRGRSGAARMAARAGLRIGAGLATTACPAEALDEYASQQTSVMNAPFDDPTAFSALLDDKRVTAVVIGPGNGVGEATRARTLEVLASGKAVVLDADALTSFEGQAEALFKAISDRGGPTVLTPHGGEFGRLFPDIDAGADKVAATIAAAKLSGAVVLLKGPGTVIAAPDGNAIIDTVGSARLATAGSGDVLAGMIGGLMAGGAKPFEAAAAAVWLAGQAAHILGPGLISEDLVETIPGALSALEEIRHAPAEN